MILYAPIIWMSYLWSYFFSSSYFLHYFHLRKKFLCAVFNIVLQLVF
jgi:hypothetical protein